MYQTDKSALERMVKENGMRTILNVLADIAEQAYKSNKPLPWENEECIDPEDAKTVAANLRDSMY